MKTKIVLSVLLFLAIVGLALTANYAYKQNKDKDSQISALNQKIADLNTQVGQSQAAMTGIQAGLGSSGSTNQSDKLTGLDLTQFQEVHLSDGSIFFGKVTSSNSSYLTLEDTYYMPGYSDTGKTTTVPQSIQLVKRGNELSGPQDKMTISLANLSFIETLKPDSQVLQAILINEKMKNTPQTPVNYQPSTNNYNQ